MEQRTYAALGIAFSTQVHDESLWPQKMGPVEMVDGFSETVGIAVLAGRRAIRETFLCRPML